MIMNCLQFKRFYANHLILDCKFMLTSKNPRVQMIYKCSVGSQKELPISDQGTDM